MAKRTPQKSSSNIHSHNTRITTNQSDYAPDSLAEITLHNIRPGSTAIFQVEHVVAAGIDGTFGTKDDLLGDQSGQGHLPWIVTDGSADDLDGLRNGSIVTAWHVDPDDSLDATFRLTASALQAGKDRQFGTADDVRSARPASTSFTDAAGTTSKVYQHWADGDSLPAEWNNNILSDNKSNYFEGEVIPHIFTYKASSQVPLVFGQSYSFNISYDYYQQNTNAGGFVGLATYDLNRTPASAGQTSPSITPVVDGTFTGPGMQGTFSTVDADITDVSPVTYSINGNVAGNVTVTFTYTGTTTSDGIAEIYYGLRIAKPGDVPDQGAGLTDGANAWTGGSLQTTIDIGGSGATSIQLSPSAILVGEISGVKFNDLNGDGVRDVDGVDNIVSSADDEIGLAGWTIFLDTNHDGVLSEGETSTITGTGGSYTFSVIPDADPSTTNNDPYVVREVFQTGWTQTTANPPPILITAADPAEFNVNFGNQQGLPNFRLTKTASVPGGTADMAGEVITYTVLLANTGNQTLSGIAVSDPLAPNLAYVSGDSNNNGQLEISETWTYRGTRVVTQTEIDTNGGGDGDIDNTASASTAQVPTKTADAAVPVVQAPNFSLAKTASVPGGTADLAGEVINYTVLLANTGNQTLNGIVVSDPLAPNLAYVSGDSNNNGQLEVSETWTYRGTRVVSQAEIDSNGGGDGDIDNTASARTTQVPTKTADAAVPVVQAPNFSVAKTASVPGGIADAAGKVITYTVLLANTGNQTLNGIVVTDPLAPNLAYVSGDSNSNGQLEVSETWTYRGTHVVTQAEIDSNGGGDGDIDNTASASTAQVPTKTADAAVTLVQAPNFSLAKTASVPGGTADAAGEVVTYTVLLANTGNQTLSGIVVSDPLAPNLAYVSGDSNNNGQLEVSETWTYRGTHLVTQAEIDTNGGGDGDIDNTVSASTAQVPTKTADAAVPVVQAPNFSLAKSASVPGGTADMAGEVINYTVLLANTGNQTLSGIVVTDPLAPNLAYFSGDSNNNGQLEVSETWTYRGTRVVSQAEIDTNGGGDGDIDNTVSARTTQVPTKTADAAVPVVQAPNFSVAKTASVPGGTANLAGEVITYTVLLANTGNQTLSGIVVTDPLAPNLAYVSGDSNNNSQLEVSETWTYRGTRVVTQAEIDANGGGDGDIDNTVSARTAQVPIKTADAAVLVERNPALNMDKVTVYETQRGDNLGGVIAGRAIGWNYSVTNNGNVTLTSVQVVDDNGTSGNLTDDFNANYLSGDLGADGKMSPGETWLFNATDTAVQGSYTNVGTAYSDQTGPDTDASSYFGTSDLALLAPTGVTVGQYINGTAPTFEQFYAAQGGVIQYTVKNSAINAVNPGVFYYFTGLSNTIVGKDGNDAGTAADPMSVLIDQSNNGPTGFRNFLPLNLSNVSLYKVNDLDLNGIDPGDTVSNVTPTSVNITNGDVTINFTPDQVGSMYVIGVKYDTGSVVGLQLGSTRPTVRYQFKTDVGRDGRIEETDSGGITLAFKGNKLLLDGIAGEGASALSQSELDTVSLQAVQYWEQQGASRAQLDLISGITLQTRDLGKEVLGSADDTLVLIDDDASGHGWSVGVDGVSAGKVDLLSVLTHEFGHVLGFDHDAMGEMLALGVRHLALDELSHGADGDDVLPPGGLSVTGHAMVEPYFQIA